MYLTSATAVPYSSGYKYAIRCNYRYVIQMDADGQHDAGNLINLYRALKTPNENGVYPDIVLGSRYLNDSPYFETSALKRLHFSYSAILSSGQQDVPSWTRQRDYRD